MKEMVHTGYMHNHMRMYWGKKILEWMETPQEAYSTTLYLNNKYFLDGRDPNSFANVAWVFGQHDRGWKEIGRAHVLNSSHANISYAVFCLKKKIHQPHFNASTVVTPILHFIHH